ncbi:MAG: hypothetical protein JST30_03105 [Armatimonadetes bacterium]|nr:hypothetical protein [Armatimonadota bacterium]
MNLTSRQASSVLAAFVLSVLTLSVFYLSRNKGPVSTVTRFHEALVTKDDRLLRSTLGSHYATEEARQMSAFVSGLIDAGSSVSISRVGKRAIEAEVWVKYASRRRGYTTVSFSLHKDSGVWLIDPGATKIRSRTAGI